MTREMKYSGVEWIGDIPSEWKVKPISTCFNERNEKVSDYDWEPLSVTKQGILKQLETAAKSDAHDARKKVCAGDFVINSRSDRKQSCGVSEYDGSVSLINIVLKHNELLCSEYIKFALKNYGFAEEFYRWGNGIVDDLWSTNYQRMKKIMIPIPPLSEQKKIANFLDSKVSEIDKIIAETKSSIENYKEYKQSVITEAVTKGLDKNVPMKDSGVEWIGDIPSGWKVCKLKHLLDNPMIYGANETGVPYDENLPRYVRITDITADNKLKDMGKLSLEDEKAIPYMLKDGDILFARSGGTVGKTFIYKDVYGKCAFAGYLIKASLKSLVLPDLIYYYTLTHSYDSWKNRIFIQSTIQNIGADKYSNMEIVVSLLRKQQQEIIEYLDSKCAEIDKSISEKEKLIANLEEYKKSLIYEYVTGKRTVE